MIKDDDYFNNIYSIDRKWRRWKIDEEKKMNRIIGKAMKKKNKKYDEE
jgi:hypothetical protein